MIVCYECYASVFEILQQPESMSIGNLLQNSSNDIQPVQSPDSLTNTTMETSGPTSQSVPQSSELSDPASQSFPPSSESLEHAPPNLFLSPPQSTAFRPAYDQIMQRSGPNSLKRRRILEPMNNQSPNEPANHQFAVSAQPAPRAREEDANVIEFLKVIKASQEKPSRPKKRQKTRHRSSNRSKSTSKSDNSSVGGSLPENSQPEPVIVLLPASTAPPAVQTSNTPDQAQSETNPSSISDYRPLTPDRSPSPVRPVIPVQKPVSRVAPQPVQSNKGRSHSNMGAPSRVYHLPTPSSGATGNNARDVNAKNQGG